MSLSEVATGRSSSLFEPDIQISDAALNDTIRGKRVLVIGGAGSIGSSSISVLLNYKPESLVIIDQNENLLAELVRRLRSQEGGIQVTDFHLLPLDYGGSAMRCFLSSTSKFDLVLNFAAIKHVRSEKDAFSTLHMFDTNILKQARFMNWLHETGFSGAYFAVSTDKAANSTSMMGATKRIMEHVLFASTASQSLSCDISSARFANVAFSNGSLLDGFQNRIARGEPLALPKNTKRYFVSLEEAGQICTLAACAGHNRKILIPRLNPADHLVLLQETAERFLNYHGYEPRLCDDEEEARRSVANDRVDGKWPVLLTPLDTSGEKPFEEFVGDAEESLELGLPNLLAVRYKPTDKQLIDNFVKELEETVEAALSAPVPPDLAKEKLKAMIGHVEPQFLTGHRETNRNLDDRL